MCTPALYLVTYMWLSTVGLSPEAGTALSVISPGGKKAAVPSPTPHVLSATQTSFYFAQVRLTLSLLGFCITGITANDKLPLPLPLQAAVLPVCLPSCLPECRGLPSSQYSCYYYLLPLTTHPATCSPDQLATTTTGSPNMNT